MKLLIKLFLVLTLLLSGCAVPQNSVNDFEQALNQLENETNISQQPIIEEPQTRLDKFLSNDIVKFIVDFFDGIVKGTLGNDGWIILGAIVGIIFILMIANSFFKGLGWLIVAMLIYYLIKNGGFS